MKRKLLLLLLCLGLGLGSYAQPDLMDLLEEEEEEVTNFTSATFKSTRLINGHTIEASGHGVLQFLISHRFGRVNGGAYEFFGLDNATIRLGLEYGVTDRFNVGIGRNSFEKTYDAFLKYKLLRQSKGKKNFPLSLTIFSSMAVKTIAWPEPERPNYFTSRLYYTFQALIARKISDGLSLQIMPTIVHRNIVALKEDKNDVLALGIGGRQKITPSISINLEYYYVLPNQIISPLFGENVYNAFSVGVDIETGGHVFQLHFTNSRGMIEKMFITETTGNWINGDIHFGFNVSRVFTLVDTRKNKN